MTASEDNLVLLRNKLKNPPLRPLFDQLKLQPEWIEEQGRVLAYLHWPLELRGAVHRTLFPNGAPGAPDRPLPPTPMFTHELEDLELREVAVDLENCMPDEVLYKVSFNAALAGLGKVQFTYMQVLWAEGVEWIQTLSSPALVARAEAIIKLMIGGLVDPLRSAFSGREVQVLAEDHADGLKPGDAVDEIALPGPTELHLGEEIEALLNQRRLQPLMRDSLRALALATPEILLQ